MKHAEMDIVYIGPWGYIGWMGFALMLLLFTVLWKSSRPQELRRLNAALGEARKTLDELRQREMELLNKNDALSTSYSKLEGEYRELSGRFDALFNAFDRLVKEQESIRTELRLEREKRDREYAELIKMKAEHGRL